MKSIFLILILLKFSYARLEKVTSEAKQDILMPTISSVIIKILKISVGAHPHSHPVVLLNI